MGRKRYLFTNKKNPPRGIFSTALGVLNLVAIIGVLIASYRSAGAAQPRLGATVLLSAILGVVGIVFGILSHMEPDMFTFFPKLGIVLNSLAILLAGIILYMGV
ncbi:MAG: DUF6142 family protein [Lachnospiraceae bacterium]|nr:DUF6142 family protein [Lachnospiraceae bacterium]